MLYNPRIALFLDFKKAFDGLEWNFIEKVYRRLIRCSFNTMGQ